MKDDRTCTMRRKWVFILVNDDLVHKVNERGVMTDVSQFLICPCTFLRFQGLHSMTLSVVI